MATTTHATGMKKILKPIAVSVALLVSLGLTAARVGHVRFNRLVKRDVETLLAQSRPERGTVVTEAMLTNLPAPVRRYLTYTGIVGKPLVRTVHLRQKGAMRMGAGQPSIPLDAEEWYTVQPPGFVWEGTLHAGPLPLAGVRDMYRDGTGNMLVKVGSLFTVVDGKGVEMDQGAMMRYLSEMIWFPAAFLGDNISFAAVNETSARVTITDHGRSATGTLVFDTEGRITEFVAEHYRMVNRAYRLGMWFTPITEYGERAGLNLPVRDKAVWRLPEGDLEYFDATITELDYNVAGRDDAEAIPAAGYATGIPAAAQA